MQVTYETRVEGATIHVEIELPNGDVVKHSVPVAVPDAEADPQAHLERIIARVARKHTAAPGRPDWLPNKGSTDTDSPGQGDGQG